MGKKTPLQLTISFFGTKLTWHVQGELHNSVKEHVLVITARFIHDTTTCIDWLDCAIP